MSLPRWYHQISQFSNKMYVIVVKHLRNMRVKQLRNMRVKQLRDMRVKQLRNLWFNDFCPFKSIKPKFQFFLAL